MCRKYAVVRKEAIDRIVSIGLSRKGYGGRTSTAGLINNQFHSRLRWNETSRIDLSLDLRESKNRHGYLHCPHQFTEQGIRNIKDSPKRAAAATELARGFGIEIRDLFWTLGAFDGAVLMEAPDDQAVTSWALKVGSLGNVRTQTLRAFRANEFENILAKVK
jgi:uncharacterized protein with GYD domain